MSAPSSVPDETNPDARLSAVVPKEMHTRQARPAEDLRSGERGWVDIDAVARDPRDLCLLRRSAVISAHWQGPGSQQALVECHDDGLTVTVARTAKIAAARAGFAHHGRSYDRYLPVSRILRFRPLHLGRDPL